jgi:2-oxoisovalerate dehydrogenase E1 component
VSFVEQSHYTEMTSIQLIDVIPKVIKLCLEKNPDALIIGEEVGHMKGGAFMATRGIYLTYPDRVINTPISEAGFTGMSLGLAICGKRPIVEIMYPDFILVAADQVFNQIAKCRYMYGDQYELPIIFRTRVGIGSGYGAQHSLEPASLFALFPGWRIFAPSNSFDYVGLFNTAFVSQDPVLIIEHAELYTTEGPVPDDLNYFIQPGKAHVVRSGENVTLIAYSMMVKKAMKAAEILAKEGISVEIIDLRSVDYANIDYDLIGDSIRKTNLVVILEEGLYCGGIGAHISFEIQRRFFDYLDGEIGRVAGKPIVMPVSVAAETRAIPQVSDVVNEIKVLSKTGDHNSKLNTGVY